MKKECEVCEACITFTQELFDNCNIKTTINNGCHRWWEAMTREEIGCTIYNSLGLSEIDLPE